MNQGTEKKGLPPLAWVGIGCGLLALITVVIVLVGGLFVFNKVKDVASDNPELTAARMIAKINPEIEEVEHDEEAGTITLREKETGKIVTLNFDEIKQGKFSFEGEDGEKVSIDASEISEEGSMKITTEEGSLTINSDVDDVPDWVPVASSMKISGHQKIDTAEAASGTLYGFSSDDVKKTVTDFRKLLDRDNYNVEEQTVSGEGGDIGLLIGIKKDEGLTVKVTVGIEENKTFVNVVYSQDR